ncbi:protein of unknown function (plasmid) [Pararobbsia alpina]
MPGGKSKELDAPIEDDVRSQSILQPRARFERSTQALDGGVGTLYGVDTDTRRMSQPLKDPPGYG